MLIGFPAAREITPPSPFLQFFPPQLNEQGASHTLTQPAKIHSSEVRFYPSTVHNHGDKSPHGIS